MVAFSSAKGYGLKNGELVINAETLNRMEGSLVAITDTIVSNGYDAITYHPETNNYAFTTTTNTANAPHAKDKMNDSAIIEALFTLKPKLRKKYKEDKAAFAKDLLKAAEVVNQEKAYGKLENLLGLEK